MRGKACWKDAEQKSLRELDLTDDVVWALTRPEVLSALNRLPHAVPLDEYETGVLRPESLKSAASYLREHGRLASKGLRLRFEELATFCEDAHARGHAVELSL